MGDGENRNPDGQVAKLDGDTRSSVTSLGSLPFPRPHGTYRIHPIAFYPSHKNPDTVRVMNRKLSLLAPNV